MKKSKKIIVDRSGDFKIFKKFGGVIDPTYYINEKKKTVVCEITADFDEYEYSQYGESIHNHVRADFYHACATGVIRNKFIGKAVCSDKDTYDVEIGKKIAYDRAMLDLLRVKKAYDDYSIKGFQEILNELNKLKEEDSERYSNIKERLKRKIEEE